MKITFKKPEFIKLAGIKKIPWMLATHAFLTILFLILITLLAGEALFYQYVVLAEGIQQDTVEKNTKFRYDAYEQVLNQWQLAEQDFELSKNTPYLNPFTAIVEASNKQPKTNEQNK